MQAGNGPVHGFVTSGLDAAFDVACRKCGVTPVAAPATTAIARSRAGLLTACAERMVDLVPHPQITGLRTAIGELVRHARQTP